VALRSLRIRISLRRSYSFCLSLHAPYSSISTYMHLIYLSLPICTLFICLYLHTPYSSASVPSSFSYKCTLFRSTSCSPPSATTTFIYLYHIHLTLHAPHTSASACTIHIICLYIHHIHLLQHAPYYLPLHAPYSSASTCTISSASTFIIIIHLPLHALYPSILVLFLLVSVPMFIFTNSFVA
jgi:uncharacterized membrane protein (DUF485 family)